MNLELIYLLVLDLIICVYGFHPVYVSNGTHIVSYTRTGPDIHAVLGHSDYRIVGLAADLAGNLLFWSDIGYDKANRGIYTSDLNGQNITRIAHDVGEVNGLSVDWVSRHIYWTDLERKTVEVSNYDGSARKIIVSTDLKTPRAIVVAPIYGYIFWADQRMNRIERAWLDGSHRRTVVKSSTYWPNQLAISIENKQFYWVDSWEHSVFSCKLNGKKCKKQVSFEKVTKGAPGFGLVVYGNTAVITTWFDTAIYSLLLGSKQLIWQLEAKNLGTRELFSIVSLNPSTQLMTYHPCMETDNGGCSHLCLPTHKTDYMCSCPTYGGITLSSDGQTCLVPNEVLIMSFEDTGDIGFIAMDSGWSREIHLISVSKSPGAVTYDRKGHMVYWSDLTEGVIYRSRIEGNDKSVLLNMSNGIGRVDGLSFNSETGCLYFINAFLIESRTDGIVHSFHTVEMIAVHTDERRTIMKSKEKAISVVVDESARYLYIALSGHSPVIMRTELDGANATQLPINVSDPIGLALTGVTLTVADRRYDNNTVETVLLRYDINASAFIDDDVTNWTTYSISTSDTDLFLADAVKKDVVVFNGTLEYAIVEDRMVTALVYTITNRNIDDHISDCLRFGCSHSCIPLHRDSEVNVRCTCPAHNCLVLDVDNKTCRRPDNFLLYADINKINMLSLDVNLSREPITIYYGDSHASIVSLTFDEKNDRVYWVDQQRSSIYLSHLHQIEPILVYKQEDPIKELTFDSRRQRLYWSSKYKNVLGYFVSSINMKKGLVSKTMLFSYHKTMKSLILHPKAKWLYWIEEENEFDAAGIGSCKVKLPVRYNNVIEDGLMSPTALFVTKHKIYFAENDGKLLVANLEGEIIEVIYTDSTDISSLVIHGDLFIVADTKDNAIKVTDIKTGASSMLATYLDKPSSIAFYHPSSLLDSCDHSGCSDDCVNLLRGDYVCTCSNGKALQDDEKTCLLVVNSATTSTQTVTTNGKPTTPMTKTTISAVSTTHMTSTTISAVSTTHMTRTTISAVSTTDNQVNERLTYQMEHNQPETSSVDVEDVSNAELQNITSAPTLDRLLSSSSSPDNRLFNVHTGEPKPSQSTAREEIRYATDPSVKYGDGLKSTLSTSHEDIQYVTDSSETHETLPGMKAAYAIAHEYVGIKHIVSDVPYFENCPYGETIIANVPDIDSVLELPIKPAGYASGGSPLPLHCDYAMTEDGVIIPWTGEGEDSRHNVTFFVTDSLQQTTKCTFNVILEDTDPPVFTYCPQSIKIRTYENSRVVNWTLPEAVDNVGLKYVESSHSPGTHFPSGESQVNYTAIDLAGNKAYCFFSIFVLHDKFCNLPDIHHGGIVCTHGNGVTGDCRVICEEGYAINPIRTFRRMFNCRHPDDLVALNEIMTRQEPCLQRSYPSLLRQRFSLLFKGPINLHRTEVKADVNTAIVSDLVEEELCIGDVCEIGNISMHCDPDKVINEHDNYTCLDEEDRMEFFISFNLTLSNSSGADVERILHDIHLELISLASMLHLQIDGHMYVANAESLSKTEGAWTCPIGQIQENSICISCPPGTFHNISLNICQYCTMGHYQVDPGQTTCELCDQGSTSPDGATSNNQCHTIPSMNEMTLFIIVTTCSFGVVFLCMSITLYLQFQRQQKRNQQAAMQKKTRYNMSPNIYVAPPPILKSKLDENYTPGHKTYSIDKKKPINIYGNHDYDDVDRSTVTGPMPTYHTDLFAMLQSGQSMNRDYSPGEEVPTGTLSRENTFSNPTYSPQFGLRRNEVGSLPRSVNNHSPGPQRKLSYDSTFSNQSPRMIRSQRTPTSDTPLITQSPLLRLKLAAYNLNHED